MPRVALAGWRGLTLSRLAFILETSLSTNRFKTSRLAVTAPCRLGHRVSRHAPVGQRIAPPHPVHAPNIARLKHLLLAAPRCDPEGLLKLIKEDHFACTTRMFEILGILMPGPRQYTDAPELTSSRLRLFTCQRAKLLKVLRQLALKVRRRSTFSPSSPGGRLVGVTRSTLRGAESYRSFRRCQSAVRKISVQPSRLPDRPRSQPVFGTTPRGLRPDTSPAPHSTSAQ